MSLPWAVVPNFPFTQMEVDHSPRRNSVSPKRIGNDGRPVPSPVGLDADGTWRLYTAVGGHLFLFHFQPLDNLAMWSSPPEEIIYLANSVLTRRAPVRNHFWNRSPDKEIAIPRKVIPPGQRSTVTRHQAHRSFSYSFFLLGIEKEVLPGGVDPDSS